MRMTLAAAAAIAALGFGGAVHSDQGPGQAHGHGDGQARSQDHGHAGPAIGSPGRAGEADRTVEITAGDIFFEPAKIAVRKGETIRFVIRNTGGLLHEFSIGTPEVHAQHREHMAVMMEHGMITPTGVDRERMKMDHSAMGMPAMAHDDPNSVMLEPGERKELVWTFDADADLQFSCNIPGHHEAGMVGDIEFGS